MTRKIHIQQPFEQVAPVAVHAQTKLTAHREQILARRIQHHGDPIARQELIEASLPLVYHIARRFEHSGMTQDDLIAEGTLGLIHAVERFDPDCGTRFHTYARWWIREAIQHAITQNGKLIRVPDYLARRLRAWSRRRNELQHTMLRKPNDEEIGDELGYTKRQTMGVLSGLRVLTTGDSEVLDHHTPSPDSHRSRSREQTVVHKLLHRLDPILRNVLELRYGLGESDSLPRSVRQTAAVLHLPLQDIRSMEREGLLMLRTIVRQQQHTKRSARKKRA